MGAILLSITVLFFSINKHTIGAGIQSALERYMSLNPGFSSINNLSDSGGLIKDQSIIMRFGVLAASIPHVLSLNRHSNKISKTDQIDVVIKFKNYKKILEDRDQAILRGYLKDPREVNGKVIHNDREIQASFRLKGDGADHWLGLARHSLRVSLKNGQLINGMSRFSIHKLRARQYPYEHAFQGSLRDRGNLTAVHELAFVKVNGEDWGIMSLEESISKEFLEKQKVKDSLVFRFSDDNKRLQYEGGSLDTYKNYRYSDPKLFSTVSRQKKYLNSELSRKRYTYVLERILEEDHANLYAQVPHLNAFFYSLAWNNMHTLGHNNSRYYFNPYTLELEPITMDQNLFSEINKYQDSYYAQLSLPEAYKQVLGSLSDASELGDYINYQEWEMSELEEKLNMYIKYFPLDIKKNTDAVSLNIDKIKKDKKKLLDWISGIEMKSFSDPVTKELPTDQQAKDFPQHLHVRHYDDGRLAIFNLLPEEVRLSKIFLDSKEVSFDEILIAGNIEGLYKPQLIKTKMTGILDNRLKILSTYRGIEKTVLVYPTLVSDDAHNPLNKSTILDPPSFFTKTDKQWQIEAGKWELSSSLVLKGDLLIREGTELTISQDVYLIVKGAIKILGTKLSPVILESSSSTKGWAGLYVLGDTDSSSEIKNAFIKNTTGITDGVLSLTGGINFYKGKVLIENLFLEGSEAEDALNIVEAEVDINGLHITNTYSDGLDCDYCMGKIRNSNFHTIGGDGLDFSGSDLKLTNINFQKIGDKGFSIGEASSVTIRKSEMRNIGVGIAVKDGSSANIQDCRIIDYKLFAGMTYSKKKHFDPYSSLIIEDCRVAKNDSAFIRQEGTFLSVDGDIVKESRVDVDGLYSSDIMKKL